MKPYLLLLLSSIVAHAQTLENNTQALQILNKSRSAMGEIQSSVVLYTTGTVNYAGHYAKPKATKPLSVEENVAI